MNNIAQERLEELAIETEKLINDINESIHWSEDFLKEGNKEETSYELKSYRRKLKRIKKAIIQKPTIALFGASQVGKSYLVKNILNDRKNKFKIPDYSNGEEYDFIADMNPTGGDKESTSVITRFNFSEQYDKNKPPIKIKLLSPKAIISILIDSYYADIEQGRAEVSSTDVQKHLEELSNYFSPKTQNILDEDDVYDIEEYLTDSFYGTSLNSQIETYKEEKFWNILASSIYRIDYNHWGKVFQILWGNDKKITQLFELLIEGLSRVEFKTEIYTSFDAILREKGTILDVERLNNLMSNQGDLLNVTLENDKELNLSRNTLCALTHEVIIPISKDTVLNNPFVEKVDILDFPGARARMTINYSDGLTDDNVVGMLLRGKVSYLFNSYSLNYEISNLFVCHSDAMKNVRIVPKLVNNWIEHNIGKTIEERTIALKESTKPPLFIIFTFWNKQLKFDPDNDCINNVPNHEKVEYKWEHRFESIINEEIFDKKGKNYTWNKDWTHTGKFQNYYLLRDFKYSDNIFSGFEEEGAEVELKKEREEYYSILEESFVSSNLVKSFFSNPGVIWYNTSTIGKDGSQYIIDNSKEVANNIDKTIRYLNIINETKEAVKKCLKAHHHSDDSDEQIRKAAQEGSEIHGRMNDIFGIDAFNFGSFIEHLSISEDDILFFYHTLLKDEVLIEKDSTNKYTLYKESSKRLNTEATYEENLEILRKDYNRDTIEDTEIYFTKELGIDLNELFYGDLHNLKNKSLILAEKARDYWFLNKLNVENFAIFIDQGFEKHLLERLFDNLKTNFTKLKLTTTIAKNIKVFVDRYNNVDKAEDMIAHMTAGIINEFVNSVGWSYYSDNKKNEIIETNQENNLSLIFPESKELFEAPTKTDIQELFEIMDKLNDLLNERPINIDTIQKVPMIKNYRRWRELMKISFIANCDIPTYNVEANRLLGEIIDKIKVYNFSI